MEATAGPGRKHSAKRDAILEALRSTTAHPGARWVHERLKGRMPDLSLGTVYRNLGLFRKEGMALSLGELGGEERFDGITTPHPHLVCTRCGAVLDLPPDRAESLLRLCGEGAGNGGGFSIDFRKTLFYGLCERCVSSEVQ
ncbi:MAG: transcriptional repressor [Treponema sp.]|jgi:Fur family peroxide stress response transcriptional regulator|nr:transcriptional repressor [Treponema sp.]